MQVREKVEKSRFPKFFPMICGPGHSKNRLAKAAGAEVSQNCFVFDVVNFEKWKVSQNCLVFEAVKFKN